MLYVAVSERLHVLPTRCTYATVLHLSSVCDIRIVAKQCILEQNYY